MEGHTRVEAPAKQTKAPRRVFLKQENGRYGVLHVSHCHTARFRPAGVGGGGDRKPYNPNPNPISHKSPPLLSFRSCTADTVNR